MPHSIDDAQKAKALRAELDAAIAEVAAAEPALDAALRELRSGGRTENVRADKVTVTAAVEAAFARLRAARAALASLRTLVDDL